MEREGQTDGQVNKQQENVHTHKICDLLKKKKTLVFNVILSQILALN